MSEASLGWLASTSTTVSTTSTSDPAKARDAAQQFEALLLSQMLKSVREDGGGWMGSPSTDSMSEYAEQQLATAMSKAGGLGLADVIAAGLEKSK